MACDILGALPGVLINPAQGAFYMSVNFKEGALNHRQVLPIENPEIRVLIERLMEDPAIQPDKRFVYYLLASTGVCVVPLTSFSSELQGFRFTLLEPHEEQFRKTLETLAWGIETYRASDTGMVG
jgi:aspartate/methionine/tyrosine aminotransferase